MNKLKLNSRHNNCLFTLDNKNKRYNSILSANFIRQTFIDYFSDKNHSYIKSSSVKPFNDPSLEFVNAGMNQFKNVFIGCERIPAPRAVNSQKCIRVGGKHNDLDSVGKDTYHHTFFEMLGNWSFNDYFKREACKMAWELITSKPYSLDPNRLYVTYFKGDDSLKLLPDLETKEIWEEIGVPKDRILPFGLKENFWEMGIKGPCGPSTEIHYDHLGTYSRPHLVNMDSSDLTELWNNVFIQFNRLDDGSLISLDKHFVDTGMGLERLVALLQGKSSNYDTDLFTPYFAAISKVSGCPIYSGKFGNADKNGLDTAYRILADHSRMASIAIADNVFPDESNCLRRVIRKGLLMSEKFLPGNGVLLMIELSKIVGESFRHIFPEVFNNLRQIEFILKYENALWEEIKSKVTNEWENVIRSNPHLESLSDVQSIGLISSIKELQGRNLNKNDTLPQELCLLMYDRHGLSTQIIEELARVCGFTINIQQLDKDILILKEQNKTLLYSSQQFNLRDSVKDTMKKLPPTDDSFKVKYFKDSNNEYCFEKLSCKVQAIIEDDHRIDDLSKLKSNDVGVLLDKSNFWSSLKGGGDKGTIELFKNDYNKVGKIYVDRVYNIGGYVYHMGEAHMSADIKDSSVENLTAEISVDRESRVNFMRNTSAAHLLSYVLREKFICNIQSFKISSQEFQANFFIYGHTLHSDDMKSIEERINFLINQELDIAVVVKSTDDLVGTGDLRLPPYVRPDMKFIHLIDIGLDEGKSFREVTIGPNVLNTKDIMCVTVTNFKLKNRGRSLTITGLSGENLLKATKNAKDTLSSILGEEGEPKTKLSILNSYMINNPIPSGLKQEFLSAQLQFKSEIDEIHKNKKNNFILKAIHEAKKNNEECVTLFVGNESDLDRLLKLSTELPIMIFSCRGNYLSARCHVPKSSSILSTTEWMNNVSKKLGSYRIIPKEESNISVMKTILLKNDETKNFINKSVLIAKSEAKSLMSKNNSLY